MTRIIGLTALLALSTGCIIVRTHDRDVYHDPPPVDVNDAPYVIDGFAGCGFDGAVGADLLTFEADVTDPDGTLDVAQVWADVYDDASGVLVESFPLYAEGGTLWYSDWLADTSLVDCWYGGYSVDLVAYDTFDAYDAITIWFDSYR